MIARSLNCVVWSVVLEDLDPTSDIGGVVVPGPRRQARSAARKARQARRPALPSHSLIANRSPEIAVQAARAASSGSSRGESRIALSIVKEIDARACEMLSVEGRNRPDCAVNDVRARSRAKNASDGHTAARNPSALPALRKMLGQSVDLLDIKNVCPS